MSELPHPSPESRVTDDGQQRGDAGTDRRAERNDPTLLLFFQLKRAVTFAVQVELELEELVLPSQIGRFAPADES